jgi:hypothetical protein
MPFLFFFSLYFLLSLNFNIFIFKVNHIQSLRWPMFPGGTKKLRFLPIISIAFTFYVADRKKSAFWQTSSF